MKYKLIQELPNSKWELGQIKKVSSDGWLLLTGLNGSPYVISPVDISILLKLGVIEYTDEPTEEEIVETEEVSTEEISQNTTIETQNENIVDSVENTPVEEVATNTTSENVEINTENQ